MRPLILRTANHRFLRSILVKWFVLLILVSVFWASCKRQEKWLGFVYPDKNDLTEHRIIGEYHQLNDCLKAVNAAAGKAGSYECGLNCEEGTGGVYRCAKTVGNEK